MAKINTTDSREIMAALIAMGISAPYASQIAGNKRSPSLELAVRIEKATGIPPAFWIDRGQASPEKGQGATTIAAAECGQPAGEIEGDVGSEIPPSGQAQAPAGVPPKSEISGEYKVEEVRA